MVTKSMTTDLHLPALNPGRVICFAFANICSFLDLCGQWTRSAVTMARILLVDDDPIVADELKLTLEDWGHSVVTASNGFRGLRQFEITRFDCVISDIIMPDMEGIGMMLEMRRKRPGTKIIMISGGGAIASDEFLQAAAMLGAVATVHKPIRPDELLRAIDRCLATEIDDLG